MNQARTGILAALLVLAIGCGGPAAIHEPDGLPTFDAIACADAIVVLDGLEAVYDADGGALIEAYRYDDGDLVVEFEQTGESAERGDLRWRCGVRGLQLVSVDSSAGSVRFEPGLLAVPLDAEDGLQQGTAIVDGERLQYRYAFEVTIAAPLEAHRELSARWRQVASALVIDDGATEHRWLTSTRWALGPGLMLAMLREQTIGTGESERDHVERFIELREP